MIGWFAIFVGVCLFFPRIFVFLLRRFPIVENRNDVMGVTLKHSKVKLGKNKQEDWALNKAEESEYEVYLREEKTESLKGNKVDATVNLGCMFLISLICCLCLLLIGMVNFFEIFWNGSHGLDFLFSISLFVMVVSFFGMLGTFLPSVIAKESKDKNEDEKE